tara:strand:- start:279 stop:551 length:273 start_codon:yes stop_codon:yes gene_type:complete
MKRLNKIKNIEEANKKLLREFDSDKGSFISSYQETADDGYNRLSEYLQPLVDQGVLDRDITDEILNLASSYADDMWREGRLEGQRWSKDR